MPTPLKVALLTVGSMVGLFIVTGLLLPRDFEVKRSQTIAASPEAIHAVLSDLKQWEQWTDWKEADPSLSFELGEISSGTGAQQRWEGELGNGRLEYLQCSVESGIEMELWFMDDREKHVSNITYKALDGKTEVSWSIRGTLQNDPIADGYFAAFAMDGIYGGTFERSLDKLAKLLEEPVVETTAKTE